MSPPPLQADAEMLAIEPDVEDLKLAGVLSVFSDDGVPGERDEMAARLLTASIQAEDQRILPRSRHGEVKRLRFP